MLRAVQLHIIEHYTMVFNFSKQIHGKQLMTKGRAFIQVFNSGSRKLLFVVVSFK